MAANKNCTHVHGNINRITLVIVYAILEWIILILLLSTSILSYVTFKFANYFGLKTPCFWCARLDKILEQTNPLNYYRILFCDVHAKEVSQLGYCLNHRKLAEREDMCEDCLFSLKSEDAASENLKVSVKCSCCGVVLDGKTTYRDYHLINPPCVGSENLDQSREKYISEGNINGYVCAQYGSIDVDTGDFLIAASDFDIEERAAGDRNRVDIVKDKHEKLVQDDDLYEATNGGDFRQEISPQNLDFCFDSTGKTKHVSHLNCKEDDISAADDFILDFHKDVGLQCELATYDAFDVEMTPPPTTIDDPMELNQIGNFITIRQGENTSIEFEGEADDYQESMFSRSKNSDRASSGNYSPKKLNVRERESSAEDLTEESCMGEETERSNDGAMTMEKLASTLRAERKAFNALYAELEEERSASAVAANQTMAMINKLQEEKAAMRMEASQYERMMEERSKCDQEALQALNDAVEEKEEQRAELEYELNVYRLKLLDYESKDREAAQDLHGNEQGDLSHDHDSTAESSPGNVVLYLEESLNDLEENRLYILDRLKILEDNFFMQKKKDDLPGTEGSHMNSNNVEEEDGDHSLSTQEAINVAEEVDRVYQRLQAVEAKEDFLEQCVFSLRKGDKGVHLLEQILLHFRDLSRPSVAR